MSGQTNLLAVLKLLQVSCDNVEYCFTSNKDTSININKDIWGILRENEGLTIIATKDYFEGNGIKHEGSYAKLTVEVHTSLELVGLTAVLAKRLADNQISANVVAGYYHDHIFVQYDVRQKALDAINELKQS